MDLLQLKYFQVVAFNEHMTRSAEQLNVSQPSLSLTISRLEQELGTPLFDRSGRKMVLNEYGRAFLARVNKTLLEVDNARMEIADMCKQNEYTVNFSVTSPQLLQGIIIPFMTEYPKVKWRLKIGSLSENIMMLKSDMIDFCITSPGYFSTEIESTVLLEEEFIVAVPSGHHLANCESVTLEEISHENFITLHKGLSFRDQLDELFFNHGIKPNIVIECDHYLRHEMLKANKGITITFSSAQKRHLFDDNIHFIRISDPIPKQYLALCRMKDKYMTSASQELFQYIIRFFQNIRQSMKD